MAIATGIGPAAGAEVEVVVDDEEGAVGGG